MSFSSITHMGWILILIFSANVGFSLTYFFLYCLIITPLFIWFSINDMFSISKITELYMYSTKGKVIAPMVLLSLSGMPPLTGFIPKWMTMYAMWNTPTFLLALIGGSLMSLYYYLNILFSCVVVGSSGSKLLSKHDSFSSGRMIVSLTSWASLILPVALIIWYRAGWTDNSDDVK